MTTPAEKFVADLYASHYVNPIDDNEFIMTFDAEGKTMAFFHVYPSFDEKTVHISFMRTYPQKKGIGTQALKRLQDLATKDGISLDLEPWENSPVPKAALRKFYAKAGFKGRDTMTWHPNVQQVSNRELGQYVRHGDNAAKVERSRRITMGTLKEAFHTSYKTQYGRNAGHTVEINKNPTRKELNSQTEHDEVGGFLHHDHLYTFKRFHSLHAEASEHLGADEHHLPVHIYHRGKEAHIQVTDHSRKTKWHHNPKTEEYIRNHPQIKKHFKDVSVGYYDEAIEGNWSHLKEEAMVGGAPTNSAGAGAIAGIGIGPQGEPGRKNVMTTMRRKANIVKQIKKEARQTISEMKRPRWEVPDEPGTKEIPAGHVRLYHQTHEKNLNSIRRTGIDLKKARGIEGPKAIYASQPDSKNRGFYGAAHDTPTVEFSVPKDEYKAPFVHREKVHPKEIIGAHKEWHGTVRYIDSSPDIKKAVLAGKHDNLLKDEKGSKFSKAVRFVKKREAALRAKNTKA